MGDMESGDAEEAVALSNVTGNLAMAAMAGTREMAAELVLAAMAAAAATLHS